eukprot:11220402-Lingulodinium_polyedra.AAC.1
MPRRAWGRPTGTSSSASSATAGRAPSRRWSSATSRHRRRSGWRLASRRQRGGRCAVPTRPQ